MSNSDHHDLLSCRASREEGVLLCKEHLLDLLDGVDLQFGDVERHVPPTLLARRGAGVVGEWVVLERVLPVAQEELGGFVVEAELGDDGPGAVGIDDAPEVGLDLARRGHQGEQRDEDEESAHCFLLWVDRRW